MPRSKTLMKKRAGGGGAAPKKIVIKPFSKPPTLPPNYYEQTSRELLEGTMNIIFKNPSEAQKQLSLQNSYQQVVNLVSHQYGPRLYRDLVETLRLACQEHVLPKAAESETTQNLLGYIQTQYQKYVDYLLLCKHVFLPLDRTHAWTPEGTVVKRSASEANAAATSTMNGTCSSSCSTSQPMSNAHLNYNANYNYNYNANMGLWQVGLEQFRLRLQQFQLDDLIYQKWWESLQLDWDGNLALDEQTLLQSTLYMWQDLAVLAETLSQKLEPNLIQFFQTKSQELKNRNSDKYSATAVIAYCHAKWMHVAYHWSRFLPKSTCVNLLENHLFKPHLQAEWLLNPTNFDPLLEEGGQPSTSSNSKGNPSSIQQLWMLAGRLVGGYKLVATAISQYSKTRGLAMMSSMSDSKAGKQKIAGLLELQRQLRQLLAQLPHAAENCSLKQVWEDVVNPTTDNDTNMVAEALAKYVDAYLRDAKKQQPDTNWAASIISGIFCYLQAKDVFEAFYKRDLAKRLLWNRIVSMDVERHFVSLLKAECGAAYTAKMEGMFQDMDWSRETMSRYKQSVYQEGSYGGDQLDMDIQVLTTGYWPVYPQFPNLILPQTLKDPREHFSNYYKTKYQGRRMTWQYALGHAVVRFKPGTSGPKYDLVVSLCQALVLLQFNSDGYVKLPQLMAAVGLEDRDEMERILQSLSLGKEGTRVLQKRDHDADKKKKTRMNVHDDDCFRMQSAFKSNSRRIRITNILMKETKEEREKTVEAVSRDRLYLIDAVLVRIMKARKTILHQQLIPQVLEQVKVPAQPADVKKRIESLIEREYMERDSKDRSRYNYLA
jgi:cullin-4